MPLAVHTAHASYPGPARLDVSESTGVSMFRPSTMLGMTARSEDGNLCWEWRDFVDAYVDEMRASYRRNRGAWDALIGGNRVVLVCRCNDPRRCHRTVLARILTRLGARYYGEITEWDSTVEEPVFAGRGRHGAVER